MPSQGRDNAGRSRGALPNFWLNCFLAVTALGLIGLPKETTGAVISPKETLGIRWTTQPADASVSTASTSPVVHGPQYRRRRRRDETAATRSASASVTPCPLSPADIVGEPLDEAIADDRMRLEVTHPHLPISQGFLTGIRYNVSLSVSDAMPTFDAFLVLSTLSGTDQPYGAFAEPWPAPHVLVCRRPSSILWSVPTTPVTTISSRVTSLSFVWTPDEDVNVTSVERVNITAFVLREGKWFRKTVILRHKESCYNYIASRSGIIEDADLISGDRESCSENILVLRVNDNFNTFLQFQVVNLFFSKMSECSKEYIEVLAFSEGSWITSKFCGYLDKRRLGRLHFMSERDAILVRVKLANRSTFRAVHYVLDRRKGCNSTISQSRGVLSSPNFPNDYYPGLDCWTRVTVPAGQRAVIRLRQLHLSLTPQGGVEEAATCGQDYVDIVSASADVSATDGVSRRRRHFCGRLSRYTQQYATLFTSDDVIVHFHTEWTSSGDVSNGGNGHRGFLMDFAVSEACGGRHQRHLEVHHESNGTLFDYDVEIGDQTAPSTAEIDSLSESQWEDCFTSIHVPYGYVIELRAGAAGSDAGDEHRVSEPFRAVPSSDVDEVVANCTDGFVELVERHTSWVLCDPWRPNATHRSSGNTLLVRVVRHRSSTGGRARLEYVAMGADGGAGAPGDCEYGWSSGIDYCYALDLRATDWRGAEDSCRKQGGHLASVSSYKAQAFLDAILNNSLLQDEHSAVWIGGNDRMYENCYEWADGKPVSYTNWFKGWPAFNYYNFQPSDDGLSNQDCVELRRTFMYPTKGTGKTEGYFWNDRDCAVSNPFICEKLKSGVTLQPYPTSCNLTVSLTLIRPREVITSPAYPDPYPSNMECMITVTAPTDYKIILTFNAFALEDGTSCQYDYVEVVGATTEPRRLCGDWSKRLKLLRHESSVNRLVLKFVSDVSHISPGFMADVYIEDGDRLCDSDQLIRYDNHCYLVVTFPMVTWSTASQICSERQGTLASVDSPEEEAFLSQQISKRDPYSSGTIYWLGGIKAAGSSKWTWTDATPFTYSAWYQSKDNRYDTGNDASQQTSMNVDADEESAAKRDVELCLSLQWLSLRDSESRAVSTDLRWFGQACDRFGSYICKKKSSVGDSNRNVTLREASGNVTSPGYPAAYGNNLHYVVSVVAPPRHRVVVRFPFLDLEWQPDCFYDYVSLQSVEGGPAIRLCGADGTREKHWEFISDNNVAYLTFHTDFSDSGGGFVAQWKTVDVSGCPAKTELSDVGTLTSVNYPDTYFNSLDCVTTVRLTSRHDWTWIEFDHFHVGSSAGRTSPGGASIDPLTTDSCNDDYLQVDMGGWWETDGILDPLTDNETDDRDPAPIAITRPTVFSLRLCGNLSRQLPNLAFLGPPSAFRLTFHSDPLGRYKGYQVTYSSLSAPIVTRVVPLAANSSGPLYALNHPMPAPARANYTRQLLAPVGYIIQLQLEGLLMASRLDGDNGSKPCGTWAMNIADPFRSTSAPPVTLCRVDNSDTVDEFLVRSHFHALIVNEITGNVWDDPVGHFKVTYSVVKDAEFNNKTLTITKLSLESCLPNMCLNNGQCVKDSTDHLKCKCRGPYTGLFCHLTKCDLHPCGANGECNLTDTDYTCICSRGYSGDHCENKLNPCLSNPCGNRGICVADKDIFSCRCHIWWQGALCEKRALKIPYKPLSQRMLEEPFWLGLITVFTVLAVLGCVWCIKRKFADKLEKFISEEIERSKQSQSCKPIKRHSLRDQQGSPESLSPQTCPRSLLSRIGLRKPSMLSLDSGGSPTYHENRSFSFDDVIRKGSGSSSTGDGRGGRSDKRSSSPALQQFDKKELLQSLVAPPASPKGRRMSLDEFIQMSEKKILERKNSRESFAATFSIGGGGGGSDGESGCSSELETSFGVGGGATLTSAAAAANRQAFRKRVNFARTLEKIDSVSFENDRETELHLQTSPGSRYHGNESNSMQLHHQLFGRMLMAEGGAGGGATGGELSDGGSSTCSSHMSNNRNSLLLSPEPGCCTGNDSPTNYDSANEMDALTAAIDAAHSLRIQQRAPTSTPAVDQQSDCSSAEVDSSWTSSEVPTAALMSEVQVEVHQAPRGDGNQGSSPPPLPPPDYGGTIQNNSGQNHNNNNQLSDVPIDRYQREIDGDVGCMNGICENSYGCSPGDSDHCPVDLSYEKPCKNRDSYESLQQLRLLDEEVGRKFQDSASGKNYILPVPAFKPISKPHDEILNSELLDTDKATYRSMLIMPQNHTLLAKPEAVSLCTPLPLIDMDRPAMRKGGQLLARTGSLQLPYYPYRLQERSGSPTSGLQHDYVHHFTKPSPLLSVKQQQQHHHSLVPQMPVEVPAYHVLEQPEQMQVPRLCKSRPPPLDISEVATVTPHDGGKRSPRMQTQYQLYHHHDLEKTNSLDLPAPLITITSNVSSCESDTDSPTAKVPPRMHYLSPFDLIRQNAERSTSLSNLSSSGYSSMASPGPSRCNSNSPLFGADGDYANGECAPRRPSPTERHRYGQHLCPSNVPSPNLAVPMVTSPKHVSSLTAPRTGALSPSGGKMSAGGGGVAAVAMLGAVGPPATRVRPPLLRTVSVMRKRSDSETTDEHAGEPGSLPDDSNDDEGIGMDRMDHIDRKIHRGELTSAKDLELYMDREKATGGTKNSTESEVDSETASNAPCRILIDPDCEVHDVDVPAPSQHEFVCPAIVVQTLLQNDGDRERCWKFVRRKSFQHKLSPVSSRSESPMSDRGSCCPAQSGNNAGGAALFFGTGNSHQQGVTYTDSDDQYDAISSEVALSPVSPTATSSGTVSSGKGATSLAPPCITLQQPAPPPPRKQNRRREKSYSGATLLGVGGPTGSGSSGKMLTVKPTMHHHGRTKSLIESAKDGPVKRSPKRRGVRVQNSVDADSSSSDSSNSAARERCVGGGGGSSAGVKEPLLSKDGMHRLATALNRNECIPPYRKRLMMMRCESLPLPAAGSSMLQQRAGDGRNSDAVGSLPTSPSPVKPLPRDFVTSPGVGSPRPVTTRSHSAELAERLAKVVGAQTQPQSSSSLGTNSEDGEHDEVFVTNECNPASTAAVRPTTFVSNFRHRGPRSAPSSDEEVHLTSGSDIDLWDAAPVAIRRDSANSGFSEGEEDDDSGSEVSFYLNHPKQSSLSLASASQQATSAERKKLLSPARVSPDMAVICYHAGGFGRRGSEDDDSGLV